MSFSVERAHRVPSRPLPAGEPPRPFLILLLNQRDRDLNLRRATLLKEVTFNGTKVMFFPDFTPEIQKQRAKFQDVKKRLQTLQLSSPMLHPAKLRVEANAVAHFFDKPQSAMAGQEL